MPSAPIIATVALQPNVVATDEPVTVAVVWDGDPKVGLAFQWRDGLRLIRNQTAGTYTPSGAEASLNCLVTIDNGFGTATAVAIVTAITPPDGETTDFDGDDFDPDDFE